MTEQELIEQMARLLAVRFVYEHDSNDYPFNYDGLSEAGKERAIRDATQLFHLVKQANYVRLADDQTTPDLDDWATHVELWSELDIDSAFSEGQQSMWDNKFRRVEL